MNVVVELLINGSWTDISGLVDWKKQPITITAGRPDEAANVQASNCQAEFNNVDGRFTPTNTSGPYYGSLGRNTQMRVSVVRVSYSESFESGTGSWTVTNGTGTFAQDASWASDGAYSLNLVSSGTGSSFLVASPAQTLIPGETISGSIDIYNPSASTVNQVGCEVAWFDGSSNYIGSAYSQFVSLAPGASATFAAEGVAPTDAATYKIKAGTYDTSAPSGTSLNVDNVETDKRSYRFYGEIPGFPPRWDPTESNVWVPIDCGGILRRLTQGNAPIGSPLERYFTLLSGSEVPVGYWSCEDGSGATSFASGVGGSAMTFTGTPALSSDTSFVGSDPLPQLRGSSWTGALSSASGGNGTVYFTTAGSGTWTAPTGATSAAVEAWGGGGSGAGGGSSYGSGGGGGGEYAKEDAVALTGGTSYSYTVGSQGGHVNHSQNGHAGTATTFTGDDKTVTAHGGSGGSIHSSGGAGGTGSTNTYHLNGGAGGSGENTVGSGGGGGGSGGTVIDGNAGHSGSSGSSANGGSGASAVTGGGPGGRGGDAGGGSAAGGNGPTSGPGGGGGGGGQGTNGGGGAGGYWGKLKISWISASGTDNALVFALSVPSGGAVDGAVLARLKTSGTIAQMDVVYHTGGALQLIGYDSSSATIFDSGAQVFGIDGVPVIVRAYLSPFSTTVDWQIAVIQPGASSGSSFSGSFTGATGNATEVDINPGGIETGDTAMGHIAVLAFVPTLADMADAAAGHAGELATDRLVRLCSEEGIECTVEDAGRWSFETSTDGWGTGNATISRNSFWFYDGSYSLLITAAGAAGQWGAGSPKQAIKPGAVLTGKAVIYTPTALTSVGLNIDWFDATGTYISTASGTKYATSVDEQLAVSVTGTAPSNAATAHVIALDLGTEPAGTTFSVDYVRRGPQMGPQTDETLVSLLQEIEDVDRGLLYETRAQFGLGYRTWVDMMNQSAAVTLDYSADVLDTPLKPTQDDQLTHNDITVSRTGGSSARATLDSGSMSTQDPPDGVGRYVYSVTVNAYEDSQLQAIANWVLVLGTVDELRFPVVTIDLSGNILSDSLRDEVMAVGVGDYIEITTTPSWVPSPVKQLAFGFTETLTEFTQKIAWNCVPESPYGS